MPNTLAFLETADDKEKEGRKKDTEHRLSKSSVHCHHPTSLIEFFIKTKKRYTWGPFLGQDAL